MPSPTTPDVVGPYRLGERLGGGGFGEVFAASHGVIGGEVAIKILHADRCTDASALRRFLDEARAVNRIHHPAIVDILDVGTLADGRAYCVMERLRGRTLRAIIDGGRMPVRDAMGVLRKIAAAVDAAHAVGIAHRDLKPDNVFVLDGGDIKLIDFGLAKLSGEIGVTHSGALLGTPQYMAPEQCRGDVSDLRADLYSFGALAYQLLTGTLVFDGDPLALALAHLNDRPEPPSQRARGLPRGADAVILALLAKSPHRRPSPLVDAVAQMDIPRRRIAVPVAIGAVATILAGAVAVYARSESQATEPARYAIDPARVIDPHAIETRRVTVAPGALGIAWLSADASALAFETPHGIVVDDLRGHATTLSVVSSYASRLPDGRWVHSFDTSETITIDDGSGTRALATGRLGEASPCDARVAYVANGTSLRVIDADTRAESDLGPASDLGVRWSPDCRRLLWTTLDGKLRVTDVATRQVAEVATSSVVTGQSGWLGNDGVVYCSPPASLMFHDLGRAEPDIPIAASLLGTLTCSIANSRDRVVANLSVVHDNPTTVTIDPDDAGATPRPIDPGVSPTLWAVAFDHAGGAVLLRQPGESPRFIRLASDGTREPVAECPGVVGLIDRDGVALQVGHRDDAFVLFGPACVEVAHWKPPAGRLWSMPACARGRCVVAGLAGDRLEVYALADGDARLLGGFDEDPRTRGASPAIALSPDGTTIVAHRRDSSAYGIFRFDGTPPDITRLGGAFPRLGLVAWAPDSQHFYVDTRRFDDTMYGIARFDLTHHHSVVYRSPDVRTMLIGISPDGKRLAMTQTAVEMYVVSVEAR